MIKRYLLLLSWIFLSNTVKADSINSITITQSTLKALPHCLHYQIPTHFCLWVNWRGHVNTTPILNHYLPDLVVSVFNIPNDNPWFEINKTMDAAGKEVEKILIHRITGLNPGGGQHSFQRITEQNIFFKEADVIGNPALAVLPTHGLLKSAATPWVPYYQSMIDSVLWRGIPPAALAEEGLALGYNLIHHIGTGLTNWGGLYPHEGKVMSDDGVKASMVIAARATDLTTNPYSFAHVRKTLPQKCDKHCKVAAIQENSKETYFQMIYPFEQSECHILGESSSYSSKMFSEHGSYVWIVWRHYEGCSDGDGTYIGRT